MAARENASFDIQFIDMMVPNHQGAVEMARIAESTAQRPELKAMAVDIIKGQAAEIEAALIEAMIPHHQSAIEAARLALQQASHPEVKDLAAGIIEAQLREIGQMQAWRAQWYGSMRADMSAPIQTTRAAGQPEPPCRH